jgi:hypothetical protein
MTARVLQIDLELDAARLAAAAELIDGAGEVFALDQALAAERAVAERLAPWPELAEAWQSLDGWDEAVAEVRRVALLQPDVLRFHAMHDRLANVAPEWAARIAMGEHPVVSGQAVLSAWEWRRAQTWFDTVVGDVDPAVLARRVERARARPSSPVPALALPVLTRIARMSEPVARCSRQSCTGAAEKRFVVNTPATAAPGSRSTTVTSRRLALRTPAIAVPRVRPEMGWSDAGSAAKRLMATRDFRTG